MRKMILFLSALYSINGLAGTACSASYAAGIGHIFKGESRLLGDKEFIKESETISDELYTLTLKKSAPVLQETQSKKQVELIQQDLGHGMLMYSTKSLKLYPEGVPGAITAEKKFIIVMCADEELMK